MSSDVGSQALDTFLHSTPYFHTLTLKALSCTFVRWKISLLHVSSATDTQPNFPKSRFNTHQKKVSLWKVKWSRQTSTFTVAQESVWMQLNTSLSRFFVNVFSSSLLYLSWFGGITKANFKQVIFRDVGHNYEALWSCCQLSGNTELLQVTCHPACTGMQYHITDTEKTVLSLSVMTIFKFVERKQWMDGGKKRSKRKQNSSCA